MSLNLEFIEPPKKDSFEEYKRRSIKKIVFLNIVSVLLLTAGAVIAVNDWHRQTDYLEQSVEQCSMFDFDPTVESVNGFYSTNKYYCVWTDKKTLQEINETDVHEQCHALVDEDGEHFCEYYT